jgi:4-oxalocrotonate tautomerase family enzyme
MPIIQCDIRQGRTPEQKRALAETITRVVHETIDAPIEYISWAPSSKGRPGHAR